MWFFILETKFTVGDAKKRLPKQSVMEIIEDFAKPVDHLFLNFVQVFRKDRCDFSMPQTFDGRFTFENSQGSRSEGPDAPSNVTSTGTVHVVSSCFM